MYKHPSIMHKNDSHFLSLTFNLTPVSALRYGPAGAWPAINTIAHTVESVKLYCGKLKVGL